MAEFQSIEAVVASVAPDIAVIRQHLHRNPELSDCEQETSALVADRLRAFGVDEVRSGVGGYGVLGAVHGRANGSNGGPVFALRADMDALPIQEENRFSYSSCRPGVMHACGHDGHTATLLGAAAALVSLRDRFAGTVRFIFQPAEETVNGAARMCEDGAMDGVKAIVALHGWPGLEIGQIGVRSGPMMASSDAWELTILGKGTHAAMPHMGVDPIVVGANLVVALQTLSSREIAPTDPVVVTAAQFHGGAAYNIIPEIAELKGTVRCLSAELRETMPGRLERIIAGVCAAFRANYEFRYVNGAPVTINDPAIHDLVSQIGAEMLGKENVVTLPAPSLGAEDFAEYLRFAPGVTFRLGMGADSPNLHTPRYNFHDAALPYGIGMLARIALRYLETCQA